MSDWLLLGFLAVGFYLYECCTWTPAAALACCRRPFRRTWSASSGAELPGNESGGFAFSDPLTLSGNIVHCSHWPIAVSPDGICLDASDASQFWSFESIRSVSSQERTVRFGGEIAFRTTSQVLAIELAGLLEKLRALPPAKRADAIRDSLGQSFDADDLRGTWSRFLKASRALTVLAALPVVWLAAVTPLALVVVGPLSAWPYLLGGLFLSGLAVSVEFMRAHRQELAGVSDSWLHAVSMTLFPIAAIRAADRLSKERVAHFNPLAVVGVFCSESVGVPILRRIGFDLGRSVDIDDSPASSCRRWYQTEKQSAYKRLLKELRLEPFTQPQPVDQSMVAYCPRCHSQFGEGTEQCSDCDNVTLMRLAEIEAPNQRKERKRKRA